MKTKYEFRNKALNFVRKDEFEYDAVHVEGIYGNGFEDSSNYSMI